MYVSRRGGNFLSECLTCSNCLAPQLKAFYVDLLVPLETNLEKDTKVVQHEQKKFLQQHKVRMESYQKAVSTMKKQRKKKATPENTEKELRVSH